LTDVEGGRLDQQQEGMRSQGVKRLLCRAKGKKGGKKKSSGRKEEKERFLLQQGWGGVVYAEKKKKETKDRGIERSRREKKKKLSLHAKEKSRGKGGRCFFCSSCYRGEKKRYISGNENTSGNTSAGRGPLPLLSAGEEEEEKRGGLYSVA